MRLSPRPTSACASRTRAYSGLPWMPPGAHPSGAPWSATQRSPTFAQPFSRACAPCLCRSRNRPGQRRRRMPWPGRYLKSQPSWTRGTGMFHEPPLRVTSRPMVSSITRNSGKHQPNTIRQASTATTHNDLSSQIPASNSLRAQAGWPAQWTAARLALGDRRFRGGRCASHFHQLRSEVRAVDRGPVSATCLTSGRGAPLGPPRLAEHSVAPRFGHRWTTARLASAHVLASRTARVWAKRWKPSLLAIATDGRLACSVRYCTTRPSASPSAVIALTVAVP
jgi:hypothetical protein